MRVRHIWRSAVWRAKCHQLKLKVFCCTTMGIVLFVLRLSLSKQAGYYTGNQVETRKFFEFSADVIPRPILRDVSAFYDERTGYGPVIRIFAQSNIKRQNLHCCLKSDGQKSPWICLANLVSSVIVADRTSNSKREMEDPHLYDVMYICQGFPLSEHKQGTSKDVILVDPTKGQYGSHSIAIATRVKYLLERDPEKPRGIFSVCVIPRIDSKHWTTGLHKQDSLEFIQLVKLLGANHLFIYSAHGRTRRGDSRLGIPIDVISWNSSFGGRSLSRILAMNDCLFRTRQKSVYSVFLDMNEILVPVVTSNWKSLLESLTLVHNSSKVGGYIFRIFSYYDETTNKTSSYLSSIQTGSRHRSSHTGASNVYLPRTVRFRSRDIEDNGDISVMLESDKVSHITDQMNVVMLPGYSYINVPVQYATVHRFVGGQKRLRYLRLDASKDKLVPDLLRELHIVQRRSDDIDQL